MPIVERLAIHDDGQYKDTEKVPISPGGDSVNLTFSDKASIDLDRGEVFFSFSTPSSSNQGMVFEILIQEYTICQSGALLPGNRLEHLPLLNNVRLQEGSYNGLFRISFYDLKTGEKAPIQAQIPVVISVED